MKPGELGLTLRKTNLWWRKPHGWEVDDPADAILDVAEEREADLVVVGNKGMTGAKRRFSGV